jgi:hypothetical protein
MSCGNNLKQVGLAIHNYESAYKTLPPAWTDTPDGDGWSMQARILPFIEQGGLADGVDYSNGYKQATLPTDGQDLPICAFRVATYQCPSDPLDQVRLGSNGPEYYKSNYASNAGVWFVYDPQDLAVRNDDLIGQGTFGANKYLKFRDCLDGLSNTLAMAEVKGWTPYYRDLEQNADIAQPIDPVEICLLGGSFKTETGHTEWADGRVHQASFTTTFTPNRKILCTESGVEYDVDWTNFREGRAPADPNNPAKTFAAVTARSYHTGGVLVGLMDGSVRFVTDSIDGQLWQDLSTRMGHEVVQWP